MFVSFGYKLIVELKKIFFEIPFKLLDIRLFSFAALKLIPTTKEILNTSNPGE